MNANESTSPCVLITNRVPSDHLEPLPKHCTLIEGPGQYELMPRGQVLAQAHKLDAIINQAELRVDAELLDLAPRLRIVANVAAGTDNLDLDEMARRGIWATNTPDAFTNSAADHTLALLLAVVRRVVEADAYVRSGFWARDGFQPSRWDGMELAGKTWGIIGYGKIGRAVQTRASGFGMKTIFTKLAPVADGGYRELDDLLATSDVVSLHMPLTEQTRQLIDGRAIARMKPGAILLNLARGLLVDHSALINALQSGQLAGAGLDVFADEPSVPAELTAMSHVVMSPHIGGGTRESRRRARRLCAENVACVLQGSLPITPVNAPIVPAADVGADTPGVWTGD